jgi:ribosomal protein S12 methylthiotransferase
LIQNGWKLVDDDTDECYLVIVNTCAFIDDAQRESIEALQQSLELKGEGRCIMVVAAGCLVQDAGTELRNGFPGTDLLIGTDEVTDFMDRLNTVLRSGNRVKLFRKRKSRSEPIKIRHREPLESQFTRYVRIADGCNTGCGFCVIPRIRGPQKSLSYDAVIAECERLLERGARELVLVAQDTTAYGAERGEKDAFETLLSLLSNRFRTADELWIRILYLNPHRVSDRLLEIMAQPPILPYFDLAIQHAHPQVLRSMLRPVPTGGHEALVSRIRERIPNAVLRATVMIGHPGEDVNAFDHLLGFLEFARFNHVGIFTYSPQDGTNSARHNAPSKDEVEMRLVELNAVLTEMEEDRFAETRGNSLRCIWDDHASSLEGALRARSWMDAPDIDRIYIPEDIPEFSSPFFWGTISGGDMMRPTIRVMD